MCRKIHQLAVEKLQNKISINLYEVFLFAYHKVYILINLGIFWKLMVK